MGPTVITGNKSNRRPIPLHLLVQVAMGVCSRQQPSLKLHLYSAIIHLVPATQVRPLRQPRIQVFSLELPTIVLPLPLLQRRVLINLLPSLSAVEIQIHRQCLAAQEIAIITTSRPSLLAQIMSAERHLRLLLLPLLAALGPTLALLRPHSLEAPRALHQFLRRHLSLLLLSQLLNQPFPSVPHHRPRRLPEIRCFQRNRCSRPPRPPNRRLPTVSLEHRSRRRALSRRLQVPACLGLKLLLLLDLVVCLVLLLQQLSRLRFLDLVLPLNHLRLRQMRNLRRSRGVPRRKSQRKPRRLAILHLEGSVLRRLTPSRKRPLLSLSPALAENRRSQPSNCSDPRLPRRLGLVSLGNQLRTSKTLRRLPHLASSTSRPRLQPLTSLVSPLRLSRIHQRFLLQVSSASLHLLDLHLLQPPTFLLSRRKRSRIPPWPNLRRRLLSEALQLLSERIPFLLMVDPVLRPCPRHPSISLFHLLLRHSRLLNRLLSILSTPEHHRLHCRRVLLRGRRHNSQSIIISMGFDL